MMRPEVLQADAETITDRLLPQATFFFSKHDIGLFSAKHCAEPTCALPGAIHVLHDQITRSAQNSVYPTQPFPMDCSS